jgi:hypothetical protein
MTNPSALTAPRKPPSRSRSARSARRLHRRGAKPELRSEVVEDIEHVPVFAPQVFDERAFDGENDRRHRAAGSVDDAHRPTHLAQRFASRTRIHALGLSTGSDAGVSQQYAKKPWINKGLGCKSEAGEASVAGSVFPRDFGRPVGSIRHGEVTPLTSAAGHTSDARVVLRLGGCAP